MTSGIDWEAEMEALDASLPERLERAAQMAERSDMWTDTERLMPATGVADLIWEAHSEILGWRALNEERKASRTCPLGEDCDLTVAWMAGRESAKDEAKARIEALEAKLAAAVTPKVKPLAWFYELATKDHEMYESDGGEYSICDMRPFGGDGFLLCRGEMPIGTWQSLEEAKSAAQADHEPRILWALEPRPDFAVAELKREKK